jgi:hypothetical protein
MPRFAVIGLIAVVAISGVGPSQRKFDCADAYRSFVRELMRTEMSLERRASLHRWALRAYHACDTGDLEDPKRLFESLGRHKASVH